MTTVVLADDEGLVRGGLRVILDSEDDVTVVGEAEDGREAVALVRSLRPDVVLMDIRMPALDGIAATREIVAQGLHTAVIILTTFELEEYVYDALRAGAAGFLLKATSPDRLVAAVRHAATGDHLLQPSITRRLIETFVRRPPPGGDREALQHLTERELDVLRRIAAGHANAEIARQLVLAEATVKSHVNRILAKLHLASRAQAVAFAYESGLVIPGSPRDDG